MRVRAIMVVSALALATWPGVGLGSVAAGRAGCVGPGRIAVAQVVPEAPEPEAPEPHAPLSLSPPLDTIPDAPAGPAVPKQRKRRARDAGRMEVEPPMDAATSPAELSAGKPSKPRRARTRAPSVVPPSADATDDDGAAPVPLPPAPPRHAVTRVPRAVPADPAWTMPLPAFHPMPPLALPPEALSSSLDVGPLVFVPSDSDRIIARSRREQRQTLPGAAHSLTILPPGF